MTGEKMDELMIVAISRAAQLAYVEEAAGAFAYLSAADRFFRYHASMDRTATLGEELQRLADLVTICPHVKVIGLSATPFRLDSGPLHKGDNRIFTDICYSVTIKELIDQGYLSPLVSAGTRVRADTSGIVTSRGAGTRRPG